MQELLQRRVVRQFIKFGIVGLTGTVIDWSTFYLLNHFLSIYYLIAKVLAFLLAVLNNYIWNRRWTFRSQNAKTREFIKFLVVALVGLGLNTLIFFISVEKFHLRYLWSLAIATATVMFWNFIINKLWVFKEHSTNL